MLKVRHYIMWASDLKRFTQVFEGLALDLGHRPQK